MIRRPLHKKPDSPSLMKSQKARWCSLVVAAMAVACSDSPSEPRTGSLAVTVAGLPAGAGNALTITGPGFSRALNASATIADLTPGMYTVVATVVSEPSGIYEPAVATQRVEVTAKPAPAQVTSASP